MKVTKDLFVWKIITHKQASDIFHLGIFNVFTLNGDGSESMIESEEELLEAYYEKAVMGIEVGQLDFYDLARKQDIVPVFWCRDDIRSVCDDEEDPIRLSEEEIDKVVYNLGKDHDARIGINWDVIKCQIQMVIDERDTN